MAWLKKLFWWLPFGRVAEIDAEALHDRLDSEQIQLLDVRTDAEWRQGHIQGAVHAPITSLSRRLPELELDKDKPVVAICLSAHRSIPAVRLLEREGFREVCQLEGGMLAWRARGFEEEEA